MNDGLQWSWPETLTSLPFSAYVCLYKALPVVLTEIYLLKCSKVSAIRPVFFGNLILIEDLNYKTQINNK